VTPGIGNLCTSLLETERERETVAVLDASRSKMRGDGGGVEHNCISTVYQSV
jgi:uncharacterized protein (DUF58 family)